MEQTYEPMYKNRIHVPEGIELFAGKRRTESPDITEQLMEEVF